MDRGPLHYKRTPDSELVDAAKAGDVSALDELVHRHFGLVYAVALGRLNRRDEAEDLTQEVFLRVLLSMEHLDGSRFSHWMTRVARNLAIDWQRSKVRSARIASLLPVECAAGISAAQDARELLEARSNEQAIHRALEQLDPASREALLLHYMEGLTHGDIARRMGCNRSTISRQISGSLRVMRKLLSDPVAGIAGQLRPRASVPARTAAAVIAVVALPASSRAAIASAVGGQITAATHPVGIKLLAGRFISHVSSSLSWFVTEGIIMASAKSIGITAAAVLLFGGTYGLFFHKSEDTGQTPAKAIRLKFEQERREFDQQRRAKDQARRESEQRVRDQEAAARSQATTRSSTQ